MPASARKLSAIVVGVGAKKGDPQGADGEGQNPPQVAGFKSEWWPE